MTIWSKAIQGLSPSKLNGHGFTTNSARVTKRRSLVDIFLVVVVAAEMMKMATGDDSPLRQGAGMGSRFVFGGYRGMRWRNF